MNDTSAIASVIISLVESSPSERILGTDLNLLVKQKHPDFNAAVLGFRNLRDFIRKNVSEVFEARRSGGDIVYGLVRSKKDARQESPVPTGSSMSIGASEEPRVEKSVWKTFVSPSGPYRLYINRDSGEFRVLTR